MKLDRELQLKLLNDLAEKYPNQIGVQQWAKDNPSVTPNMHYLADHGLISGQASKNISGDQTYILAKITAAGMDFLADDGGLTAILGVVTIKLHADTIEALLVAKIEASDLPPEKKSWLRETIKSLSVDALKDLSKKLMEQGLAHAPDIIPLIEKWIS